MRNYQKALDWLNELSSEGKFFRVNKKPSLDTINFILNALGRPDKSFQWRVVVGGTAGKGTVCRLTEDVLLEQGKTVATLMSPHLQVVTERVRINGKLISANDFGASILEIKAVSTVKNKPTYYEAIVLSGILAAKKLGCEILITEVGIGGEWDAVNAVQGKRISALTFIGDDHLKTLGGSLEAIAKTKAGIFTKDTVYAISAEKVFTGILSVKSPIEIKWVKGLPQKMTKKIARKICEKILGNRNFTMRKIRIPARWEKIENIILDGAHARPRFEFIKPKLKKITGSKVAIIAMTKNHNPEDLTSIFDEFDEIFWVTVLSQDRDFWLSNELKHRLGKGNARFDDPLKALTEVQRKFPLSKIFVLGSFYLCGKIRNKYYPASEILMQRTEFP